MRLIAGVVVAGLIVTGCSTADSKDIRTSGIKADFRVTVKDNETRVDVLATLRAGTLTYVELGNDEAINVAGTNSMTEQDPTFIRTKLRRNKSLGVTNYSGRLEDELLAVTHVSFDLHRDSDNESAQSNVNLPERLQLIAPAVGTRASRQSPITVRISGPSYLPTTVNWTGSCIQEGELRLPPRSVVGHIPAGRIKQSPVSPSAGQTATTSCTVTIKVFRRENGTLSPAFKDGSVVAEAQSSRDITSIP
ncbi:hypothetical protein [Kribbella albertanoniae]|uniref:Uncharacterized protein n=1 Tax=Kribbella albertanoniae TaxID=1266829 RepID=A0A4R4QHG7_9ACTN|nr:hypothetical protein [Kribbella albertanoniae]TDC34622.1 hypothetical protein E1261_03090 [Kribbella albertanoniae]